MLPSAAEASTVEQKRLIEQPSDTTESNDYDDVELGDDQSDTTQVPSREPSPQRYWMRKRKASDLSVLSEDYMDLPLRPTRSRRQRLCQWLPWLVSTILQLIIILLLLQWRPALTPSILPSETQSELRGKQVETGGDINGLYKDLSHTYKHLKPDASRFIPNMTSNADRLAVRKNWDSLMPLGSGSVAIPDYAAHPYLGNPIVDDPIRSGPLFEASWTHALHCLYYTLDSYHQLLLFSGNSSYEVDPYHTDEVHATHCFEYIRNNILCNLDMTLEGDQSLPEEKEMGQAHVCRNYDEARLWIEERRVDDIQDIVGP